ncbi:hypothetical protein ACIQF5_20915 [Streptomyces goshikiensis]|uniref:hypothetical protein n=1 Tax=Streptomyces goshikiensis TaxID=1942 RepID=UPI00381D27D2
MTTVQRYEIEAWLGDDHGLTDDQVNELTVTAQEIAERCPGPDDAAEREAALTVAYRLKAGHTGVVEELAATRARARAEELLAYAGLRQAALILIAEGESESRFQRRAGVDRMTVRKWLGKR